MRYTTDKVLIYDTKGNIISEVQLPETITAIPSKRTGLSETGLFYKGSGIVYQKHMVNEIDSNVKKVGDSGILYERYMVTYPHLIGKYGIFLFRHQPMFDDLEGACGTKELKMIDNSTNFELSAIEEVVHVIKTGIDNSNIYAYRLKDVNASPYDVIDLVEYVLTNHYNTAWDKNLWSDIYCYKYVRDVADWFQSDSASHKIGTIYALLNSMYINDIYLYIQLIQYLFGTCNSSKLYVLYYSGLIVNKYCDGKIQLGLERFDENTYAELLKLLFSGKACCHLMNDGEWKWVREYYMGRIDGYVKTAIMKNLFE